MGTTTVDLNQLHYFVQVSKTHSFTQAARKLGVPKSSVSRAIASLESRLGVRLVERTTRSVALTEAGELYLDHCKRVVDEAEQADLAVGALLARPRGRLRVGAPVAFAQFILAPMLGDFLVKYPELQLSVQIMNGNRTPREGNFDVLIGSGAPEDSGLLIKPLMKIRLGIYASPAYLRAREKEIGKDNAALDTPADLRKHRLITTSCGHAGEPTESATWRLRRGAERRELKVESTIAVPDPSINHNLAVSGAGVAMLAQWMVRDDLEARRLVRVLPEWEPDPVELHALYPSRLNASPKVRAFLEFLRDRIRVVAAQHA